MPAPGHFILSGRPPHHRVRHGYLESLSDIKRSGRVAGLKSGWAAELQSSSSVVNANQGMQVAGDGYGGDNWDEKKRLAFQMLLTLGVSPPVNHPSAYEPWILGIYKESHLAAVPQQPIQIHRTCDFMILFNPESREVALSTERQYWASNNEFTWEMQQSFHLKGKDGKPVSQEHLETFIRGASLYLIHRRDAGAVSLSYEPFDLQPLTSSKDSPAPVD